MKRIGLITVGGDESQEYWKDVIAPFEPEVEVVFVGVLDGLSEAQVEEQFGREPGEGLFVSQIGDDTPVEISAVKTEKAVLRLAEKLFADGFKTVFVLCTGGLEFPEKMPGGLLVIPQKLLYGILQGFCQDAIGFIVPEPEQIVDSEEQYHGLNPIVRAASPYGSMEDLIATAKLFRDDPVEIVVTDCMSFTAEMGKLVAEASGKQVLVPRQLLPNMMRGLLTQE